MQEIKLSILICSIIGREHLLRRLLAVLEPQKTEIVEILIDTDNKEITTGAKRNRLLRKAQGEYIVFIDDDDLVAENYVHRILKALETSPDCCGIEGEITFLNDKVVRKFVHSLQYSSWFEKNGIYYRCPNHISPVKRIHALAASFPDISRGEDKIYSERLLPYLKKEEYIKEPIYSYFFVGSGLSKINTKKERKEK